jgi:hypothetical protein
MKIVQIDDEYKSKQRSLTESANTAGAAMAHTFVYP